MLLLWLVVASQVSVHFGDSLSEVLGIQIGVVALLLFIVAIFCWWLLYRKKRKVLLSGGDN